MEQPSEKHNILEFYQYMKSDKTPPIIYADKKIDGCANNPEFLQQQKLESIFLADIQCQQFGHLIV